MHKPMSAGVHNAGLRAGVARSGAYHAGEDEVDATGAAINDAIDGPCLA